MIISFRDTHTGWHKPLNVAAMQRMGLSENMHARERGKEAGVESKRWALIEVFVEVRWGMGSAEWDMSIANTSWKRKRLMTFNEWLQRETLNWFSKQQVWTTCVRPICRPRLETSEKLLENIKESCVRHHWGTSWKHNSNLWKPLGTSGDIWETSGRHRAQRHWESS